jgi:hypothetical protein
MVALLLSGVLLPLMGGCIDWSYRHVALGHGPADYARVLPEHDTRRTPQGTCYLGTTREGRTDAIVLQWGDDRRVFGKWQATHVTRAGLAREPGYRLRGSFDPVRAGMDQAGPLDVLRATLADLGDAHEDALVRDAHAWVAIGVARLLEDGEIELDDDELTGEAQARAADVPGGGRGEMRVEEGGAMHFAYEWGAQP